ncbi:glycosyltransferase family 4 protein [Winogradskyella eckloniae]|uniref:glycosyltransferase family 4 protein n=1 Tax=Winogradskyella eckloniae TaxID=1089306 RepID=UPI00156355D8|nr:glycosyltransferase family 1 protein [Winogradskyella eckloniae]NRD19641.1 glycosyltransferase family 4 protein [Winogradskyella eckloniae]
MKKKIIIDFHYLRNTNKGFGQYCLNLAKHLPNQDQTNLDLFYYLPRNWKKKFGKKIKYKSYFSFHKKINFLSNYDVFHGVTHLSKIEPQNAKQTKFIYTIHDAIFSIFDRDNEATKKLYAALQQKINKSSSLVYISEFTKTSIHKKFQIPSHVKEYVIYNGNPLENEKPIKSNTYNFPYLLSVGEFRGYKNQDKLIPMLSFLNPEIKLIFIGKCSKNKKQEIIDLAKKHHVEHRVIIKGIVSEDSKKDLYSNAQALVHPSLAEGFGLPVVEAMSFGIPVIISNKTSLPEVGGTVAHYWNEYEPEYMANIVKTALSEFKEHPEQKIKELNNQAKKFSWSNAAKQYLKVYNEV